MGKKKKKSSTAKTTDIGTVRHSQSPGSTKGNLEHVKLKGNRIPEVIVFQEPGIKSPRSDNCREKQSVNKHSKRPTHTEKASEGELDFTSLARQVREFGATGLRKGERRKYEQEKLQKLGAHKRKVKVPYPVGIERIKRRQEKEERERERDRAMGIIRKKDREEKLAHKKLKRNFGRWIDKAPDLEKSNFRLKTLKMKAPK